MQRQVYPVYGTDPVSRAAQQAAAYREMNLDVPGFQQGGCRLWQRRAHVTRTCGNQCLGIVGTWRREYRFGLATFDQPAILHDKHAVSDLADHPQIMRNEQHRHPGFTLQVSKKVEDLRLNRDVQCRCRFVSDQQVWIIGQRHGDHHPLTLPTR